MLNLNTLPVLEPWLEYKTPIVRQLAFAVASPNILSSIPNTLLIKHHFNLHSNSFWNHHYQNYIPRLLFLDQNPTELNNFISKLKSTRLGLRFEMLIWFWLLDANYHPYVLLQHSIQIIDGSNTIGELDFLIFNTESNEVEHWEVALKYYLAESDFSLPFWYGLNRSDTLAKKLNHFTNKQFQFTHALEYQIQKRFAVLKGQLFLPNYTHKAIPKWVNLNRRLGSWGTQIPPKNLKFYRLSRQEWLCPNLNASSKTPIWWTDGLYNQELEEYSYMYRNKNLINKSHFVRNSNHLNDLT